MSWQAQEFVALLPADTAAQKAVLFALAKEHKHRTGKIETSERKLAKLASVSARHTHTCLVLLEQSGRIRRGKGKNQNCLSSFEFVNFQFKPKGNEAWRQGSFFGAPLLNSAAEVASTPAAEVASARNKEERKIKVNQIPPTPLLQRGDEEKFQRPENPPCNVGRRKLTTRDIRNLEETIDSIYKASVGSALSFREVLEAACVRRLIHPDDARQAIGLTPELDWDRKRPPEKVSA